MAEEKIKINESTQRPAWLHNDFYAGNHRYITSKAGLRIKLENFFVYSEGETISPSRCREENA